MATKRRLKQQSKAARKFSVGAPPPPLPAGAGAPLLELDDELEEELEDDELLELLDELEEELLDDEELLDEEELEDDELLELEIPGVPACTCTAAPLLTTTPEELNTITL